MVAEAVVLMVAEKFLEGSSMIGNGSFWHVIRVEGMA